MQNEVAAFRMNAPCYVNCGWSEIRTPYTISSTTLTGSKYQCFTIGTTEKIIKIEFNMNFVTTGDSWVSDFFVAVYNSATGGLYLCTLCVTILIEHILLTFVFSAGIQVGGYDYILPQGSVATTTWPSHLDTDVDGTYFGYGIVNSYQPAGMNYVTIKKINHNLFYISHKFSMLWKWIQSIHWNYVQWNHNSRQSIEPDSQSNQH